MTADAALDPPGPHGRRRPEDDLLVALAAADCISRPALCRLGASLELWCDAAGPDRELARTLGVPREPLRRALALRGAARRLAERARADAEAVGATVVSAIDRAYPTALHDLPLPPPALWCRGTIPVTPAVAIVGSREADGYGIEVADCFASTLAVAGVTVVSGFARGVDAAAHRAALAIGGTTVAVMGSGVDVVYPRGHAGMAEEVAMAGALLSEFPLGSPPRRWHFPIRNRLIAALARVTLVVQAALRSGTLHTAHHAMELGRDVFAVPGRIFDERSMGTNGLLADGALVARTPADVLDALGLGRPAAAGHLAAAAPAGSAAAAGSTAAPADPEPPTGLAGKLLAALPHGRTVTAEDLADAAEVAVDRVLGVLLELELAGRVRREPGPRYRRPL